MPADRILRRPEVLARIGLSTSSLYEMMAQGRFPRPMRIGRRAVGWKASVVDAWIDRLNFASLANFA